MSWQNSATLFVYGRLFSHARQVGNDVCTKAARGLQAVMWHHRWFLTKENTRCLCFCGLWCPLKDLKGRYPQVEIVRLMVRTCVNPRQNNTPISDMCCPLFTVTVHYIWKCSQDKLMQFPSATEMGKEAGERALQAAPSGRPPSLCCAGQRIACSGGARSLLQG
jgi:hypothetical protein